MFAIGRIRRLILIDPGGRYIDGFAPAFERTRDELSQQIRMATRRAVEAGVDVRWFDGPVFCVVIGDPHSNQAWARVEIPISLTAQRPGFRIRRETSPELYRGFVEVFERMWQRGRVPNALSG